MKLYDLLYAFHTTIALFRSIYEQNKIFEGEGMP